MAKDIPIGINLGPQHLTSAYITGTNEVVTVARVEASQAWKDFFIDTLRVERNIEEKRKQASKKEVEELISSTLSEIQQATEKQLGRPVEINSISYPEHFKGVPYVTPVAYTAIKVYPGIKDVMQVGPYLNSTRLAYGLNTAEALGYAPGADLDDTSNLLLHFDYQKQFLEVSIMDVGVYVDNRERFFRIDDFGGSKNLASPESLAELKSRIQTLLHEQMHDKFRIGFEPTRLKDFRFIIFSGEAVPSEFDKIRQVITELIPEFTDRFRDSVDPFWVGAIGAARCGKEFAINPPNSRDHFDFQMAEE